jgi:hypothetical protein
MNSENIIGLFNFYNRPKFIMHKSRSRYSNEKYEHEIATHIRLKELCAVRIRFLHAPIEGLTMND